MHDWPVRERSIVIYKPHTSDRNRADQSGYGSGNNMEASETGNFPRSQKSGSGGKTVQIKMNITARFSSDQEVRWKQ